ncbi:ORF6N domain-containing protein [Clostridium cochlearium]|uniref:ORF6N domain-containing protein n=1 Tax=Clostridium cochlearium TaxID=1494 RepID=UPI000BBCA01A|nr:ORF6N domain-containing protein [Clostridium cochlearium]
MSNLIPVEFKKQRVITTELLAQVYETDVNNIQANFKRNEKHFKEGKHYFKLEGEVLKEFKNRPTISQLVSKHASQLYLWTERGANRHCKILDTDKAWEQFDNLEETYFRVKEATPKLNNLSPQLQLLINMELKQKQLESSIEETKEEVQAIRDVITINPREEWRKETNRWINKICYKLNDYKTPREEIYRALEERAKCKLSVRLKNLQGRAALNGMAQSKVDKLNNLDVIANDVRLKEIYISIVRQMAIRNGIGTN